MARVLLESHRHPHYPRLALDLRADSQFYQARVYLDGKVRLKSTKATELPTAFKVAEVWYKAQLRASVAEGRKHPLDKLTTAPTLAELFTDYRRTLPPHRRDYVNIKWGAIGYFWRALTAADVTPQRIREFYVSRRRRKTHMGSVVTNNTLSKDVTLLRQILTHAIENGHLTALPIMPKPGKIAANPRPWLQRDEWQRLFDLANVRVVDAVNPRLQQQRLDLLDFMVFMVESMMRVGELRALTAAQVTLVPKQKKRPEYLVLDVHGKHGHRQAIAGGAAVSVFERRARGLKPGDLLWPHGQRDAFRELLIAAKLRTDAFGHERNLKSLRATAISFRILEQAPTPNLLMIARNAGTSVAMIDAYYCKRLSAEMSAADFAAGIA